MKAEGLHPGLRAPFAMCEMVRQDLLALLATLTRRDWTRRASRETWSVAEAFDHLIRAEVGTSKMARRLIRGDYAGVTRPADVRLYDSSLSAYPYGRYPAPATLVPGPLSLEDAPARFESVHQRFVDELRLFEGPDADTPASEDPDTGLWFTLGGWVRLQGLHEAHHLQQITSLLERP
jgi:hypothetical protein